MRRPWLVVVGLIIAGIGLVWALQGFGVLGGSAMSGSATWAILGTVGVVGGLAGAWLGARGRREPGP